MHFPTMYIYLWKFWYVDLKKIHDVKRNITYGETIARYEKRFQAADKDNNKLMDRDEFADFLHPRKSVIDSLS